MSSESYVHCLRCARLKHDENQNSLSCDKKSLCYFWGSANSAFSEKDTYYVPCKEVLAAIENDLKKTNIQTDSDIEDFAELNNYLIKDVCLVLSSMKARGTSCEGCINILGLLSYSPSYPCNCCTRICKDFYQSSDKISNGSTYA